MYPSHVTCIWATPISALQGLVGLLHFYLSADTLGSGPGERQVAALPSASRGRQPGVGGPGLGAAGSRGGLHLMQEAQALQEVLMKPAGPQA